MGNLLKSEKKVKLTKFVTIANINLICESCHVGMILWPEAKDLFWDG